MDLSELIGSVDILEYISQFTDFTEKNGEYWALSPLKEEKTPSFSVRRETNSFYDFSSGVGGNVLTFIRYYHGCGYRKAIDILKSYAGAEGELCHSRRLASTEAAQRYQRPKKAAKAGKGTVLSEDYMDRYEKNEEKLSVWRSEGISTASMDKFQVRYDRFSNRIVYPIRDPNGRIVNVSGRTLDPDWKEKGLRKYTYFLPWGELKTVYGLYENRQDILQAGEIILFEGCKSVLLADTYGIHNTGAILTSHLNPNQMKLLAGLGCRVVFALDKDVSVRDDHNIRKLKQFVNVEYVWDRDGLLGEKDSPVDRGPEVWRRLYERRLSWR